MDMDDLMLQLDFIARLAGAGLPLPEPVEPRAELSAWQAGFVEDWAWFSRRPIRFYRIRPAKPFELSLLAEALETPRVAHASHVIVSRAGPYLIRCAFRPRLEGEQDLDCGMWTDRSFEATLLASGCDLEPLKRMRREATGAEGFAGMPQEAHAAVLDLAASFRDNMTDAARAAALRLRALTLADALDRAVMEANPGAEVLRREAVPFEPLWSGGEVPADPSGLAMAFYRPGGVLARCLGWRNDGAE